MMNSGKLLLNLQLSGTLIVHQLKVLILLKHPETLCMELI